MVLVRGRGVLCLYVCVLEGVGGGWVREYGRFVLKLPV